MTNLRWEVKHEDGQVENADARHDQVDDEVERLAPQLDEELDVRVHLRTARVLFLVADGRNLEDVPLDVDVILGEVHAQRHRVVARLRVDVHEVDLEAVVRPAAELEETLLQQQQQQFVIHGSDFGA